MKRILLPLILFEGNPVPIIPKASGVVQDANQEFVASFIPPNHVLDLLHSLYGASFLGDTEVL